MNTTAVFTELLVIGLQAVAWIALAAASFLDFGSAMSALRGWETLVTIVVLAIAYVLGVVVDRIADSLLGPLRNRTSQRDPDQVGRARMHILKSASPLSSFREYQRSRMRLMRGTTFNLAVALPIVNIFVWRTAVEPSPLAFIALNAVTLIAIIVTWNAYLQIGIAQDRWLNLVGEPSERNELLAEHRG